jgi:hypothetical protein
MTETRVKLIVLSAAGLLAVQGVAHAQSNPWRVDPGAAATGGQSGMQAFEQGFQRGFEQGLRAGQGIGASPAGPAAAAAAGAGALPATGAPGWVGSGAATLGHGAGYPGDVAGGSTAIQPRDGARWGEFPPLEGAEEDDRRHRAAVPSRRRPARPRDGTDDRDERERPPPAPAPPPAYAYPGAPPGYGYGYGYGYGGYGVPPGYAAGPSTFGNPYGGLAGPALIPGIGFPGGW